MFQSHIYKLFIYFIFLTLANNTFADEDTITNLSSQENLAEQTSCQRLNRSRTARVIDKSRSSNVPLKEIIENTNYSTTVSQANIEEGGISLTSNGKFAYTHDFPTHGGLGGPQIEDIADIGDQVNIDNFKVCPDTTERLGIDNSIGSCSGTLVGEDLLLTSSHCFETNTSAIDACMDLEFNFNQFDSSSPNEGETVGCSQIVYSSPNNSAGSDFAIIRLSSKPSNLPNGYAPVSSEGLQFSSDLTRSFRGKNTLGFENFESMGYPHGGDLISSRLSFFENLDKNHDSSDWTFKGFLLGGMSGGGVFNESCELVGVNRSITIDEHFLDQPMIGRRYQNGGCIHENRDLSSSFTDSPHIKEVLDHINSGQLRVVNNALNVNDPRRYNPGGVPTRSIHDMRRYREARSSESNSSHSLE